MLGFALQFAFVIALSSVKHTSQCPILDLDVQATQCLFFVLTVTRPRIEQLPRHAVLPA